MVGAVIGDIIGSVYEFNPVKTTDFELFTDKSKFTDDTVMTVAIMKAYMESQRTGSNIADSTITMMKLLGKKYIHAGYGPTFGQWLLSDDTSSYNSYGNGSAMRITAAGYIGNNIKETKIFSHIFTAVTHDHPESFKAAEATAVAIYMARTGSSKEDIEDYITENYYYFLKSINLDKIRPYYKFHVESQFSVPEALRCFFDANSFEEAVRLAVSLGGDADTQAAIAGSIAGEFYGIPQDLQDKACEYLDDYLLDGVTEFENSYIKK